MIVVILIASLLIRLVELNQSFWLDEAINVTNANMLNFKTLIFNYSLGDFHPPFYHIVLKSWILLTDKINLYQNMFESIVRIPSVIFGVLTVFITYLVGKNLFEKKTALIASTLIATSPLHIYYSQEARMYMLAAFLSILSVYFFLSLLKKDKLYNWAGFITSTTLLLYTDYLPYFIIPTFLIYLFINRKSITKNTFKTFFPAFIIIFILLIPWLIIFPNQLKIGLSASAASPAWAQVVGAGDPKSLLLTFVKFSIGRISFDNNSVYAIIFAPVAIFFTFLFGLSFLRLNKNRSFLIYYSLVPIVLAFITSFFIPIYSYFRLIFILPAFYLLLASGINIINWPKLNRALLISALFINISASIIYFTYPKFQRENWRDATNYVVNNSNNNSIVIFESNFSVAPFDYYNQNRIEAAGALSGFVAKEERVKERVELLTKDKNKVFLFQYLTQITDPQGLVFKELSRQGFQNNVTEDFPGVGFVYVFIK